MVLLTFHAGDRACDTHNYNVIPYGVLHWAFQLPKSNSQNECEGSTAYIAMHLHAYGGLVATE